jgi:putative holliday junction resolvase
MTAGRVMAFDYGMKRTGIAVSDETRTFSFPLETVETLKLMNWLAEYMNKENVSHFVVGQVICADNTPSAIEPHILGFIRRLQKAYPVVPIARIDERYTSKMAFDTILQSGVSKMKRRDKSLIDKVSASIILQSFIDSQQNQK